MADSKKTMVRDFSRVIITLDNTLVPDEYLSTTPSMLDGLDYEAEIDLRILGCELIQTSGILLKLPQVAMATGQVLFQRFYYSKSFIKHSYEVVAMACVNLASKIEEAPRRIRDVVNVFHHIKQVRSQKTITALVLDQNYINLKNQVIKAERRVLKELGFCVHVKHPHKIIVTYLEVLEAAKNQRLVQFAWNYMNDSFRSNVFVRFHPETIACACIYLAARQLQIALPNNPPWYGLFGATDADIQEICRTILRLYTRGRPNVDELESGVNKLKKVLMDAKLKSKDSSSVQGATPTIASRTATPDKSPAALVTRPEIKKLKSDDEKSDGSSFGRSSFGMERVAVNKRTRSNSRSNSRHKKRRSSEHRRSRSPVKPGHRHHRRDVEETHRSSLPARYAVDMLRKSPSRHSNKSPTLIGSKRHSKSPTTTTSRHRHSHRQQQLQQRTIDSRSRHMTTTNVSPNKHKHSKVVKSLSRSPPSSHKRNGQQQQQQQQQQRGCSRSRSRSTDRH